MSKVLIRLLICILIFPIAGDQRDSVNALLDGLHKDAHKGNYQNIADEMDTLESILNTAGKL